jgi:hypothetical protein
MTGVRARGGRDGAGARGRSLTAPNRTGSMTGVGARGNKAGSMTGVGCRGGRDRVVACGNRSGSMTGVGCRGGVLSFRLSNVKRSANESLYNALIVSLVLLLTKTMLNLKRSEPGTGRLQ